MNNIMPPVDTPDNAFHDGNLATGEQGTIVPSLWLNNIQNSTRNIQQEIISVLTKAGIEIDESQDSQLLAAIIQLIADETPTLPIASLLIKGIVQLSSATDSTSETLAATPKAVREVDIATLKISNNLSEIADAGPVAVAAARSFLGLGGAAVLNVGAAVNTVAAGDDPRLVSSFQSKGDLGTIDLNSLFNINLHTGVYYQSTSANATPARNYPIALGCSVVITPAPNGGVIQEITTYAGNYKYFRSVESVSAGIPTFGPWRQVFTTAFTGWTNGGNATAGWSKNPLGYIEQWGRNTVANSAAGTLITLPQPFPGALTNILITTRLGGRADTAEANNCAEIVSNSSFRIYSGQSTPSLEFFWRVYGS